MWHITEQSFHLIAMQFFHKKNIYLLLLAVIICGCSTKKEQKLNINSFVRIHNNMYSIHKISTLEIDLSKYEALIIEYSSKEDHVDYEITSNFFPINTIIFIPHENSTICYVKYSDNVYQLDLEDYSFGDMVMINSNLYSFEKCNDTNLEQYQYIGDIQIKKGRTPTKDFESTNFEVGTKIYYSSTEDIYYIKTNDTCFKGYLINK